MVPHQQHMKDQCAIYNPFHTHAFKWIYEEMMGLKIQTPDHDHRIGLKDSNPTEHHRGAKIQWV